MEAYIDDRFCKEVRKYPHLYSFSMKEYKDVYMGYLMGIKEEIQEANEVIHFTIEENGRSLLKTKDNFSETITETNKKSFACPQCGKSFPTKGNLNVHIKIHTGEKRFSCLQFGKSFQFKGRLDTHIRIHTGEKLFNCSQCGRSFHCKTYLSRYMKIHNEDPSTCAQCGKSFTMKEGLKRHMRNHTG
ncbi:gastrula zinc finger protein XlCGF49.1-like [Chanodichthys erythropterus]|uniref:gastrula zinc finger protein XlCGF49.1-like n=1 Tax=Chanodichthys erythropterus TaxID=933992 RepID=UPI00351F328A